MTMTVTSRAHGEEESSKKSKGKKGKHRKHGEGTAWVVNDDAIKLMRRNLADIGCKLLEVEADGNCLFRSMGDQLFGDQQQHEEIRKRIVSYIELKRDDFEPFMEDEEKFDHYCTRMREEGTWGGNQEIYAAARLFGVYIVIHQEHARMMIECDSQRPSRVLHLAYHGSDHYDSVRSLRDQDLNLPPATIELDVEGWRPEDIAKRWKMRQVGGDGSGGDTGIAESIQQIAASTPTSSAMDGQSGDEVATLSSQMEAASISRGPITPLVLSKKAQRLLKKQQQRQARSRLSTSK